MAKRSNLDDKSICCDGNKQTEEIEYVKAQDTGCEQSSSLADGDVDGESGEDGDGDVDGESSIDGETNLSLARRGEEAAAHYLHRHGYSILERNWACIFGEADIICQDEENDILVFVEVKTRRGISKGMPEEAVTPKKRAKYEKIAACYLQDNAHHEMRVRFDVISILALEGDFALMKHFVNAFGVA